MRQPTAMRRPPPRCKSDASLAAVKQMLLIAALISGAWLLAAVHLAAIARPGFVAGALFIGVFYIRRSPWQYLTAALWFWTISPFVRRVVDYYGGFQQENIVLVTPYLITLLSLKSVLTSRELLKRPEAGSGLLLLGPVFYGLGVSLVKGDLFGGALSSLDWLIPLLIYFYLIVLAPRIDEAEPHFRSFFALNMLIITAYGLYQAYYPTAWDLAWIKNLQRLALISFAATSADGHSVVVRPFSILNSPGPCAIWLGALILLSMHFRTRLSVLLLPAAVLFLAMTEVRMTVGTVILGLVLAVFRGGRHVRRSSAVVLGAIIAAAAAIAVLDPAVTEKLIGRFAIDSTLFQNDVSVLAREELYRTAPALIDDYPLGQGIGVMGKGAHIGRSGSLDVIDSGVIAPFVAFGWIAGMIYQLGSLTIVAQACLAARSLRSPAVAVLAIVAATGLAGILFCPMIGLQGIVIWFSTGYASAIAIASRRPRAVEGRWRQDRDSSSTLLIVNAGKQRV